MRRPGRREVVMTGLALFAGSAILLMSTLEMGATRDESFYFRFGRSYADWFADLDAAADPAAVASVLGRRAVESVWSGNFEHPPLMKSAFAASWRAFARKERDLSRPRTGLAGQPEQWSVGGLAPADGFPEGAQVSLLAPLVRGQQATDPGRVLGRATVTSRLPSRADLRLDEGDRDAIIAACRARPGDPGPPMVLTGCRAREDRPLALMSEMTAMRFPGVLTGALAVLLTFLLGEATLGFLPGLLGALAFLFVPRHFFHAHLCAFDMGIVAGVLATLYAFWRSLSDRRYALVAGVAWGLALLIKHNAFFLPVPLVAFWLWNGRRQLAWPRIAGRRRLELPPLPLALLVMPLVALPMLFTFWPRLWYDPWSSLARYFGFHLEHEHYMQWYFGRPLQVPPFPVEFPFALTLFTVPEVFTFLSLLGVFLAYRARPGQPGAPRPGARTFLLLNGLVPIILIALPSTPIFGGVKHWMTGMPMLLLFAGYALTWALRRATERIPGRALRGAVAGAVVLVVFAGPVRASLRAVPFGTAYWNDLIAGGIQGAADKQLMRLYWGYTTRQALDWLNENAPRNASVFFQNTTWDAWDAYRRDGLVRHDLRYLGGPAGADISLIEPQKAFAELDIDVRRAMGVAGPTGFVTFEGVPMLRIYTRPEPPRAAPPPPTTGIPAEDPPGSTL